MTARKSSCVTTLAASGNVVYSFVSFRSKCDFHQTSCVMPRVPLASFSGLIVVSVLRCYAAAELWGRWVGKFPFHCHHVIGFSGLVDFWVIKIKSLWSFARVVRRDHVNRARNADHTARACEMFVYSRVKITRLYDYQTWHTFWEIHEVRKGMWAFFPFHFAFRVLIGWAGNLRSRDRQQDGMQGCTILCVS